MEERREEEAAAWAASVRRDFYPHYAPAFFGLVPPPGAPRSTSGAARVVSRVT